MTKLVFKNAIGTGVKGSWDKSFEVGGMSK